MVFDGDEVGAWCAFVAGVVDEISTNSEANAVYF